MGRCGVKWGYTKTQDREVPFFKQDNGPSASSEALGKRHKRSIYPPGKVINSRMFTGTYQNTLDSKNRMIIPSKYREVLGGHCMLSRGFDKCLYIYSMEDWEVLVDKIKQLKQSDRDVRKFIREFFSNTEECHLDSQGRILIPQHLRDYAGINKDLVTKGALDKIEVWSSDVLEDPEGENMMDNDEFVAKLDIYDL